MAWDRAVRPRQQPDHPNDRCRINGAGRALIVEGDVTARHRCAERAAGIGDAATRFAELIEDRGALGAAEVQAVGNAERPRARARDVPRGLRDRRLATLVRIEPHVAAVAVGLDRDAEVLVPHAHHSGVAGGSDDRARLDGRVVLLKHPALGRNGWRVQKRE